MEYIHSDLYKPTKNPSYRGNKYFITFIYEVSWKVWVYLLNCKYQAFKIFVQWKTIVENQFNRRIKTLGKNNKLEFCNKEFNHFINEHIIYKTNTIIYTP